MISLLPANALWMFKPLLFCLLLINTIEMAGQEKGTLHIIIKGLRNNEGLVGIRIYNQALGFPSDKTKALQETYVNPLNGEATLELSDLNYGNYAIGCIHDENNSKDLDRNFIGIPKEGFGTSNNPKAIFGPPSFNDAKFELKEPLRVIIIKLVYF